MSETSYRLFEFVGGLVQTFLIEMIAFDANNLICGNIYTVKPEIFQRKKLYENVAQSELSLQFMTQTP